MSSIIQLLVYIFICLFVYCLTYFTFGILSCLCVCAYVYVSLCLFVPLLLALKCIKVTFLFFPPPIFGCLGVLIFIYCVRVCVYVFHLLFPPKCSSFCSLDFFSFASVCETLNFCDQAKIKLTFKMSEIYPFYNTVSCNESKGQPLPFLSWEASSPPCACDKQGVEDYRACGEVVKNPKLM